MSSVRQRHRIVRKLRQSILFRSWVILSILWLVAIEWLGRQFVSDLGDVIPSFALLGLVVALAFRHRTVGLPGIERASNRLVRTWNSFLRKESDCGLDFRRLPAYPQQCPPITRACLGISAGLFVLGWISGGSVPTWLRANLAPYFYVGYLLLIASLWLILVFGTISFLFITYAILHDAAIGRHTKSTRRSRKPEIFAAIFLLAGIVAALIFLPPVIPIFVLFGLTMVSITAAKWPGIPRVLVAWKKKQETQTYGLPLAHLYLDHFLSVALLVGTLFFFCRPELGLFVALDNESEMPVTEVLGLLLCWSATLALGLCTPSCLRELWFEIQSKFGASKRPVLSIASPISRSLKKTLPILMGAHGWKVRVSSKPPRKNNPHCVEINLDSTPKKEFVKPGECLSSEALFSSWPRSFHIDDLKLESTLMILERRNHLQLRRVLIRRLERMFKIARRRSFQKGEGIWIGCQHWFIAGLFRDESEEEIDERNDHFLSDRIGPAFSRLLDSSVRSHYRDMMEALVVDLIFVDDAVQFRGMRQVLRTLFEIYDVHGGQMKAEERFFSGIPRVRVIIDEIDLNQRLDTDHYAEPDYEDIGRARILHIFRDRGDEDEDVDTPTPSSRLLLPQLV